MSSKSHPVLNKPEFCHSDGKPNPNSGLSMRGKERERMYVYWAQKGDDNTSDILGTKLAGLGECLDE